MKRKILLTVAVILMVMLSACGMSEEKIGTALSNINNEYQSGTYEQAQTEIVKLDTLYPDFKIEVDAEQQRLLFEGGYPVLAKVAKRKGLPYPHVNQQGEIEADADWWATMQAAG